MTKKAIVTGVTGQDGSYLAELLLSKGYEVVGLKRRTSTNTLSRLDNIRFPSFSIVEYEISDSGSVYSIVEEYQADEIYNLAAQSHVKTSFDQPDYTFQVNTIGVINFLEAIRRFSPHTKFYQASTSEMFGKKVDEFVGADSTDTTNTRFYQDENTTFEPQSPYAAAKLASHHLVRNYREGYKIFGCCGILFNHESERRGEEFVTRKITKWIADFFAWKEKHDILPNDLIFQEDDIYVPGKNPKTFPKLRLGNLEAFRDWGYAVDYVEAMWMMLQQDKPDDYVICTGETHTIRDFLDVAFLYAGIADWSNFVIVDPEFYRPAEVNYLKGDNEKAKTKLGWEPTHSFEDLVKIMIDHDFQ